MRCLLCLLLCVLLLPVPSAAQTVEQTAAQGAALTAAEIQARRPDLFDAATGFRIGRQRAPTPSDIPTPARRVTTPEAQALLAGGALALDVYGATRSRYDELDGTWLVADPRLSLPGAVWLPEVGRGQLSAEMAGYLAQEVSARLTADPQRGLLVFCIADCWMSWNAAQRLAAAGHAPVYWYREGTDGWAEAGLPLEPVTPVPVSVD